MCGRYNVIDDPDIRRLMDVLGLPVYPETRLNIAPGGVGQIVYDDGLGRILEDAHWSLLIERKPDGNGFRPSPKYSTFNARAGKLGSSPLWKGRFHHQRAIIPASGFHEWTGAQGHKQCHNIRAASGAMAFGGLYEIWDIEGQRVPAFSIITLPPHPRFNHIHSKSFPLMLEPDDFDLWLDPDLHNTDPFQHLLTSHIPVPIEVTPVRSPDTLTATGETESIPADNTRDG